jgi:hypothetical protein
MGVRAHHVGQKSDHMVGPTFPRVHPFKQSWSPRTRLDLKSTVYTLPRAISQRDGRETRNTPNGFADCEDRRCNTPTLENMFKQSLVMQK